MQQLDLVHDDVWAALRGLVSACGGSKKVGELIWPAKGTEGASKWLDDCLNPDRAAKLCLDEFFHLLRIGRERGFHAAKHYLDDVTFYERSAPANPADRKAQLQEQFIAAKNALLTLNNGIVECEAMEREGEGGPVKQILSDFYAHDLDAAYTPAKVQTSETSSGSDLEARIDYQALLLHTAPTPDERRTAWSELTRLHAMRSPRRIAEMENEAGLR